MSWILLLLVLLISALQANSSGIFELRVISFDNVAGKDDFGKCCSGISDQTTTSNCKGTCRPRFRVCLKEYQVKIDTTSPCTFGDVMTKEMRADNLQNGYENSIVINFPFTWPGTFSLIVEAWHGNETLNGGVLVSRLTRQKWLDVSDQWTEDVHNSKYTSLKFEYRVTCNSHYYGKGCENLCRARDDSFGHYSCSPMGERVCLSGWTGDYCSKPRCLPGCDEQHGHCTEPNECRCQSGWEGPLCNQCQRYPGCMHGTCVKPWDCLCNEGWGGLFCNQDLNFCTNHRPCRNGGTCFNTGQGSYTCSCPADYDGTNCEIPSHDCTESPCLNGGTCTGNATMNICVCPAGYEGTRCDMPVVAPSAAAACDQPPCTSACTKSAENPCHNNGTCVDGTNESSYQCICPVGFTGERCETDIDDCSGRPCLNGATCIDKINEFECECVAGYFGALCQNRLDYWSSSAAPSARLSSESKLTTEHVIVIATISTFVPLVVLVAVIVIVCLKQRRKREQARADEEARLQNEQNTANSSLAKRGAAISPGPPDHHIIRNSWGGKCTNNTISSIISSQKQFT